MISSNYQSRNIGFYFITDNFMIMVQAINDCHGDFVTKKNKFNKFITMSCIWFFIMCRFFWYISSMQVQQFTLFVIVGADKSILDFKCYPVSI